MKARIKFSKSGTMKFVGHLDLMRYFQKVIRRSGIAISYSQGYSPHQILSFASPLGVGLTSDGEYLDMQLEQSLSSEGMIQKMNEAMHEEVKVLSFKVLPDDSKPSMSFVAAADYLVSIKDGYLVCDDFQTRFLEFINQNQILILKKTKKSEKEMDLKPFIYEVSFEKSQFPKNTADTYENGTVIFMQISAGSVVNIKPELIMQAFCNYIGIPFNTYAYQVHRMELYADVSEDLETRQLVSLDDFGQDICMKSEHVMGMKNE